MRLFTHVTQKLLAMCACICADGWCVSMDMCIFVSVTERSHKYVYLRMRLCACPRHSVHSHHCALLCASLCLCSRPSDEIQIKNIKARITFGCCLDDRKILAWQ